MKTKVFKIELFVDADPDMDEDEVRDIIENVNWPNDCLRPRVVAMEAREIQIRDDDDDDGDFDHPIFHDSTFEQTYRELFG